MVVRLPGRELEDPRTAAWSTRGTGAAHARPARGLVLRTTAVMMRAARFAAQLGFTVAPRGGRGDDGHGRADRDHLRRAVRDELVKLVRAKPRRGLSLLVDTGLADLVLPELPR